MYNTFIATKENKMQNAHVIAFHKARAESAADFRKAYSAFNGVSAMSQLVRQVGLVERDYHNAVAQIETRKAKAFRPIVIK